MIRTPDERDRDAIPGDDTDMFRKFNLVIDPQHPYPGLFPFYESDKDYFFGRKREVRELFELIESNPLTVTFGKSGVGKTSLLQAGLMPKLRSSYFLPLYIRLDFNDCQSAPITQVKTLIYDNVRKMDPEARSPEDLTLWEYFGNVKILGGFLKPLLVFDQFEEIFTAGKNNPRQVNQFIIEVADLIENRVPLAVQKKMAARKRKISSGRSGPSARVMFSLREDYLPQLEMFYRYIPSIRHSRYRVTQMQGRDAIDAVLKPAKDIIKDPRVGIEIIKKIPGAKDTEYKPFADLSSSWQTRRVEPFLLSLFCYQVNESRLDINAAEISPELIKNVSTEDIIKNYYERNINRFAPHVKTAIEDLLLTEEGYRKLQDIHSFKSGYNVSAKDIERLVNRRIIRKERRNYIDYIELIHDVLAPILKESRDKRLQQERHKKELARRKRIYSRIIFSIVLTAVICLSYLTRFAFQQKNDAEIAKAQAENATARVERAKARVEKAKAQVEKESRNIKAYELAARSYILREKNPVVSFRLAEAAYLNEKKNPDAYKALLASFYNRAFYPGKFDDQKQKTFAGHTSERSDFYAIFSPRKSRVLTVTSTRAMLWNFQAAVIKQAKPPRGLKLDIPAFSPEGQHIVFRTDVDEQIALWNTAEDAIVSLALSAGVNGVALSAGGKHILTANRDYNARLWDRQGNELAVFKGHEADVNSAAFSPDGAYVVTASWDKTVKLWDVAGNAVATFTHPANVIAASFSHDGQYIVSASEDKTARLWNLKGSLLQSFEGHTVEVTSAVFSPDGRYIITGSVDRSARLWDFNGIQVYKFDGFRATIHNASISPDNNYILIAPARGPAHLRLANSEAIINLVNENNVPQLDEETKKKYKIKLR